MSDVKVYYPSSSSSDEPQNGNFAGLLILLNIGEESFKDPKMGNRASIEEQLIAETSDSRAAGWANFYIHDFMTLSEVPDFLEKSTESDFVVIYNTICGKDNIVLDILPMKKLEQLKDIASKSIQYLKSKGHVITPRVRVIGFYEIDGSKVFMPAIPVAV